jgi:NAD(P)-dependent dehydrogenase (short-subunit alcohol dehydrogenase family)
MAGDRLFGLGGKVAAVIGAGSGIGEAVACGCARQGATVRCLDVDLDAATDTAEAIAADGGVADAGLLDITDANSVDDALDGVTERHGGLDIVVCTPAVNVRKPILDYTGDEFDRVVGLNLKGSFHVLQAAGRIMTARGRGSIIFFSSIRAQVVEPGQSVYASTKAGIVQLVRTAAAEFGPSGVRVNAVGPGVVETPLTAPIKAEPKWYDAYAAKSVFNRWATAEEMVGPTVFLASDAASFVTGTLLMADGGWTAVDGRFDPLS